jgi:hypothetical protein
MRGSVSVPAGTRVRATTGHVAYMHPRSLPPRILTPPPQRGGDGVGLLPDYFFR